jgi:UDP-N-acetylmuramate dehydrogenase
MPYKYEIARNHSLQQLTTIRTGGSAAYFASAASPSVVGEVFEFIREQRLPFYVLGNGSNVLVGDEDFNGVVIRLEGDFRLIVFDEKDNTVTAGAGASLMKLGNEISRRGHPGYAYMAVIPGTVGGAVRINAGTLEEGDIRNHFLSALVLDPETGETAEYDRDAMKFSYRESVLARSKKIVLQATFALPQQAQPCSEKAQKIVADLLAVRKAKQPAIQKNFGSTFKRPIPGNPPGWYLERVGMKGAREGGAMVAEEHANWILNVDNAKSRDIKKLIALGQKRVFEEFGILLQREVIYLPEDTEEWT